MPHDRNPRDPMSEDAVFGLGVDAHDLAGELNYTLENPPYDYLPRLLEAVYAEMALHESNGDAESYRSAAAMLVSRLGPDAVGDDERPANPHAKTLQSWLTWLGANVLLRRQGWYDGAPYQVTVPEPRR